MKISKNFIPTRVGTFGRGSEWSDGGRNAPDAIPSVPDGIPVVPDGIPTTPGAIPVVPDGGRNVPGGIRSTPSGIRNVPNGIPSTIGGVEMKKALYLWNARLFKYCIILMYFNPEVTNTHRDL